MTTDPLEQPPQPNVHSSSIATSIARAADSPMVIGAIVAVLLIGGFYMASRIANTDEAPEHVSQPTVTNTKPVSDIYISPVGQLELGVTLYDKETKQPWGTIAGIPNAEQVEVLRINNMTLGDDRTRGTASLYDRSYITSDFVVKSEKRGH